MTNVLRKIDENKIIIIFMIVVLLFTVYTGLKERNLDNINNPRIIALNK